MISVLWVTSTFTVNSIYQVDCSQLLVGVLLVNDGVVTPLLNLELLIQ